ncbi:MAG: hypothetical protein RIT27_2154 [Pseudomonadota bacterium]|jgi:UDP-N-acetylmuramoyl-tripeptide--D-alanyl-D-alanine ligase
MITADLITISKYLNNAIFQGENIAFKGCSIDSRTLQKDNLYVALKGERFDGHQFIENAQQQGAVALLVERKVNCNLPQLIVSNTKIALGELAAFWRQQLQTKIVAITGSNGKTTTKEMVSNILKEQFSVLATQGNLNNEIGVPLTLFQLNEHHHYAVIEMGANHLQEIAHLTNITKPQIAMITNCAPAHLEGFGSIEGVSKAKGEIYQGLSEMGIAIINVDDKFAHYWRDLNSHHQILTFGLEKQANITAKNIQYNGLTTHFILSTPMEEIAIKLNLAGKHNLLNALGATACAFALNIDLKTIAQGLEKMQAVSGRLQRISGIKNSIILNDTYNANPASLKAALQVLKNCQTPRWMVLGDMLELGANAVAFHREMGEFAKQLGIDGLIATGKLSKYAVEGFGKNGFYFEKQEDLITFLKDNLPDNATLLVKGSRGSKMENVTTALTLLQ